MACFRHKRRMGIGGDIAGGALSGFGLGMKTGNPLIGGVGALVGAGIGLFQGKKREKAEEEARKQAMLTQEAGDYMSDLNSLQAFNNQFNAAFGIDMGNQGLNSQAGLGIEQQPTEIASDILRIEGADHNNGGVDVDANGDGFAEYELEGGEIVEGTRVYSKRLKVPQDFVTVAKDEGFSVKRGTYSEVAESLGRQKDKYEDKMDSFDQSEANTGMIMLERIDNLFNHLFYTQEFANLKRRVQ